MACAFLITLVSNFYFMCLEKVDRPLVLSLHFRTSDVDVVERPSFPPMVQCGEGFDLERCFRNQRPFCDRADHRPASLVLAVRGIYAHRTSTPHAATSRGSDADADAGGQGNGSPDGWARLGR